MRKHSHRASQATVTFTSLLCLTTLVWPTAPFLLHEGGPVAFSRAIQGSYGGRAAAVGKGSRRSEVGGSDASPSCGCFATVSMVTTDVSTLEHRVETELQPAEAEARQKSRTRHLESVTKKPNPKTDRFRMKKFHHVEFYCGDATAAASRFVHGLGMALVAKSDQSTGNAQHASYVLQSNDLRFVCTAPYSSRAATMGGEGRGTGVGDDRAVTGMPWPGFDLEAAHAFFRVHGMAARAIGIEVDDAREAYEQCTQHGGIGVRSPALVEDIDGRGSVTIAEVHAYGDVVLRFISFGGGVGGGGAGDVAPDSTGGGEDAARDYSVGGRKGKPFSGAFLPNFRDVEISETVAARGDFGLQRADHIVGNVWDMLESVDYLAGMTGMHEFAEFCAGDIGTVDSGLNSIVLASNNEMVLLPLNEPTFGTKKKSQIQTYLEQNDGPGLQHMALKTNNIFRTMRLMRANSALGGFEFMEPPGSAYYRNVRQRIPSLSEKQVAQLEELGLLADKDDEGVLLQVFTKPVGDRPTLFFEIIQRIGCAFEPVSGEGGEDTRVEKMEGDWVFQEDDEGAVAGGFMQRGGCGGFGLGNFKALFESIERYESTLAVGTDDGSSQSV